MKKLTDFIKKNRTEFWLLVIILAVGAFLRLYDLNDSMHFANDEGRDAFVVKSIVEGEELPLLGPAAPNNRPDFHLGPAFYYLLAPFFWLSGSDPVGGAYLVALLSIASLFLIYYLGKKLFDRWVGLLAAFLMATNFLMIRYSRWTWNPHPVPFFILLLLLALWKLHRGKQNYLILLAISLGFIIQLHGTALFVLPVFLVVYWIIFRPKIKWQKWLLATVCFLIVISPLRIYDLQNNLANTKGFFRILGQSDSQGALPLWQKIDKSYLSFHGFWDELTMNNRLQFLSALLIIGILAWLLTKNYQKISAKEKSYHYSVLALWFFIPLLIFIFYKEQIPPHYYSLIYPLCFLLIAAFLIWLLQQKHLKIITGLILLTVITTNLFFVTHHFIDLEYSGSRANSHSVIIEEQRKVTDYIADDIGNHQFNFYSEPSQYYDQAYLYLLSLKGIEPSFYNEAIGYVVLNPKGLALTENWDGANIIESNDFGNVRVLKIKND